MGVSTNFASLFEKLKIEDPSTTRESQSIPSHDFTSCAPPSSSLSEASLVRLLLNALQGLESALICIQKLSHAFSSHPADRTYHQISSLWNRSSSTSALGKILTSLGCSGSLVFLLHKFVDKFINFNAHGLEHCNGDTETEECASYSLVNQAFAVAVGKVLEGYVCALDTLFASAQLRRSSTSAENYQYVTCLTSAVHSEVTLLEVYLHTKELRAQIEALGNICNMYTVSHRFSESSFEELSAMASLEFEKFYRGGNLLTYLYTQLQVADPAHSALLKFLFLQSFEPYCGFIRSWIFKAEINDPYKEFIVEYANNVSTSYFHCEAGMPVELPLACVRKKYAGSLPCFLKDLVIPIVRAGQQLQVLKKLFELCSYGSSSDCRYEDFLPSWSGHSINDLFWASPISLSKENLEVMATARNSYYRNMLEKLENRLEKLEFRYLQVVPDDAVTIVIDNFEGDIKTVVSFTLDNRDADNMDSDDSCAKDDFCMLDEPDSPESSSLSGSEEQAEARELVDDANIFIGEKDIYLSSLKFMSSSIHTELQECKGSGNMKNSLNENCEEIKFHGNSTNSDHNKTSSNHLLVSVDFGEPTSPCMLGASCTCSLTDRHLPSNLSHNSEASKHHQMFHQQSLPELRHIHSGFLDKDVCVLSKMTSFQDTPLGETLGENKIGNDPFIFSSFTSQQWKAENHFNFFSANPMLKKSALFHQANNAGEEKGTGYYHSLSCYDFSTVEDPCKVSLERIAANVSCEFGSQIPQSKIASPTNHKNQHKSKRSYDGGDISMGFAGMSKDSILDSKKLDNCLHVSSDFCGANSWQSMLGCYNFTKNENFGDKKGDLLASFDIPLDFIIDKCLLQEIMLQYRYVSKLTIKLLEEGFGLQDHLRALRRYYFMESADWADLFIMSLWNHKWSVANADQRIPEIQGMLELSIQRSSCEQDPYKDRLFVYIRGNEMMPLSTSAMGVCSFNFVGLGYQVAWPVNIVLTASAFKFYADIFNFLMQVKLAVFSLNDTRCSLKALMSKVSQHRQSSINEQEAGHFNLLMKIRQQIYHFVSTLQQYVHSQLSHVSWCKFLYTLKFKVRDMMDLEAVHNAYLSDALDICFLSNKMQTIGSIIEIILQCAFDFRSCLSNVQIVGPDQVNSQSKLSGINMSQVVTIKRKFEKNLSDLHLCYLKSPKHGEFGISRFWSYINYNDYYFDAGNTMGVHAFRV